MGVQLGSNLCQLCKQKDDNTSHLFFYCKITKRVWKLCDKWVGELFVHHNQAKLHFHPFPLMEINGKKKEFGKECG